MLRGQAFGTPQNALGIYVQSALEQQLGLVQGPPQAGVDGTVGVKGLEAAQDGLVQPMLHHREAAQKGLPLKAAVDLLLIINGHGGHGIEKLAVMAGPAHHMAGGVQLEIALLGPGHGADQAVHVVFGVVAHGFRG